MKNVKMPTSDSYLDALIESFKENPERAAGYLTAIIDTEDPEPELLLSALKDVAEALCEKMPPEQAKDHKEKLEKLLANGESAIIYSLGYWLNALGLQLTVTVKED